MFEFTIFLLLLSRHNLIKLNCIPVIMFSELELKIIKDNRISHFGNALTGLVYTFTSMKDSIDQNQKPSPKQLMKFYGTLLKYHTEFDNVYFHKLSSSEVNPLKSEQDAWKLLSPFVSTYLKKYSRFANNCELSESNETILQYLTEGIQLLKKWQIIGRLYKTKFEIFAAQKLPDRLEKKGIPMSVALPDYEHSNPVWLQESYDEVSSREEDVKKLIQELELQSASRSLE